MSIKFKITLLFTIFSLIILILFSGFILIRSYFLIYGTIDNNLEHLSEEIGKSIFNNKHLPEDIEILGNRYWITIYSEKKNVIYKSFLAKKLTKIPDLCKSFRNQNKETFEIKVNKKKFRYLDPDKRHEVSFRIFCKKFPKGYIQIAYPMESTEESFQNLLGVVAWGIPIFIILIAILGYYFSYKTLLPVNDIIKKAKYISDKNLNIRLPIQSKDELGKLCNTLNDLFERLEKAFKKQKDFTANVSHELKTPLSMIKLSLENIYNNGNITNKDKELMDNVISNISMLQNLISKLLLLSQIDYMHGNPEIISKFKKIDLTKIIETVANDFEDYFENKNIKFIKNIEKRKNFIKGDAELIEKMFFNLFLNAHNYTPANGVIEVKLHKKYGKIFFHIKNNGKGISEKKLPYIFDRFYRADKSRSRETGSTGLGLAICKSIVELHNGKITVRSRVNSFTEFQIFFNVDT